MPLKLWKHFQEDSLFRNSLYLMISMAIIGVMGFVFWVLVARIFTPKNVGIATAFISSMALLSNFSLLGFNVGLIRYLPKSTEKNDRINSAFLLVTTASIISAVVFLLGINVFSPQLSFLQSNIFYIVTFTLFTIGASINTLVESVFMAYRAAGNILIKNTILSILKLLFPLALIFLGSYGIFASVSLATLMSAILGLVILLFKYHYVPELKYKTNAMRDMMKFSGGNYIAGFLSQAPTLVLPILIVNKSSPVTAAYYYISSMILAFLMIISQSTTQSLLAEGSHDPASLKKYLLKSILIVFVLLLPAITIIILFGDIILRAFGKTYVEQSFSFLQIMSISAIFMSLSSLGNSILRLLHEIKYLIGINALSALIVLGICYLFIPHGLIMLGWAWTISQAITILLYAPLFWRKHFVF